MGEARSLTYSINVEANTSQAESNVRNLTSSLGSLQNGGARLNIEADTSRAESNIRNVTGNLGGLQSQVSSVGSAFRSSFFFPESRCRRRSVLCWEQGGRIQR